MGAKENGIQVAILHYLTHFCIQVGRVNTNAVFDRKKDTYRAFSPYAIRGFSDIFGLALPGKLPKGTTILVEVKTLEGTTSPEQAFFLSNVAESGNTAILARSFDDVRLVLERKVQPDASTGIYIPSGALRLRK